MAARNIVLNHSGEYFMRGLYFVDEGGMFEGYDSIDDDLAKQIKPPFKLLVKTYYKRSPNEREKIAKKTYPFNPPTTIKNAIKSIKNDKPLLKEKALQDPEVKKNQSEAELRKSVTLQQYWDDVYCPYKLSTVSEKEKWKPSTEKDMKSFYNAWIKDTKLASMKVMDIERNTIEVLITKIQETRSKRTSKKAVECLSPLFKKFYYENHIVKLNPADIKLGDLDNKREVEVSISMAKRLYDAMENYPIPQYRDIFLWLRTGRRLGEVLSLEMTDIDIDKRLFHIIPDKNKAGKRTTFVLRDELLPSLENKTSLIHPSKKDTVMDSHTVRHHWTNVLETAKISDIHLHDIRHIIGTILRDSGVNEELRALVLGHTRSGITARYASKNAELANDIFDFFLEKINGELGAKTQWPEYYKDEDE